VSYPHPVPLRPCRQSTNPSPRVSHSPYGADADLRQPQGAVISLLLANAYLHELDVEMNVARAQSVARRLQAGRVAINGMQHDPLAPFGGYKQSGTGREFGLLGLESFLEAKAIMTLKV
jgi:Aldehyde dehydrogenase family